MFVQVAPTRVVGDVVVPGSLQNDRNYVNDAANRAILVTSNGNGATVTVVDTTTGTQVGTGVNLTGFVLGAAVTADGTRVVVTTNRSDLVVQSVQAVVINTVTGAQIGTAVTVEGRAATPMGGVGFPTQLGAVLNANGGRAVLVANSNGFSSATTRFAVIDTVTGTQIGATASTDGLLYSAPQFNAAGDRVVAVTRSNGFTQSTSVVVINANTGAQVGTTVTAAGQPWQTLTSTNGSLIALYGLNFNNQTAGVTLVDTTTGTQVGNTVVLAGNAPNPTPLAFNADGTLLAASVVAGGTAGVQLVLINTATGAPVGPAANLTGTVSQIKSIPTAARVVVVSYGSVAVLDSGTGALVGSAVALPGNALLSVTTDGSLATFVTTSGNRLDVTTVDAATGTPVGTVTLGQWDSNPKFSADGGRVAVTSYDSATNLGQVGVFDITTGAAIGGVVTLNGQPSQGVFSADGTHVVFISTDSAHTNTEVVVFNTATGSSTPVFTLAGTGVGRRCAHHPERSASRRCGRRADTWRTEHRHRGDRRRHRNPGRRQHHPDGLRTSQHGAGVVQQFAAVTDASVVGVMSYRSSSAGVQVSFINSATGLRVGDTLTFDGAGPSTR